MDTSKKHLIAFGSGLVGTVVGYVVGGPIWSIVTAIGGFAAAHNIIKRGEAAAATVTNEVASK